MADLTYYITRIHDTYANLLSGMGARQTAMATDTWGTIGQADDYVMTNDSSETFVFAKQFKIASDDVTASYCSNNFGATTFHNTVTMKNDTAEDTDEGRESRIDFKGVQSGNEVTTLGRIEVRHNGSSDDQKGEIVISLNDGNDSDSPTEALRIEADGSVFVKNLSSAASVGTYNAVYYDPVTDELFYWNPV